MSDLAGHRRVARALRAVHDAERARAHVALRRPCTLADHLARLTVDIVVLGGDTPQVTDACATLVDGRQLTWPSSSAAWLDRDRTMRFEMLMLALRQICARERRWLESEQLTFAVAARSDVDADRQRSRLRAATCRRRLLGDAARAALELGDFASVTVRRAAEPHELSAVGCRAGSEHVRLVELADLLVGADAGGCLTPGELMTVTAAGFTFRPAR